MIRGSIWWARLPESIGSMPGYRRPVIIVQSDNFNRSRINTVIVAIVTSNLELARAPGNVLLPAKKVGLPKDSVINVSQLFTIDKSLLEEKISELPPLFLQRLEAGLRLAMAL